MLGQKTTIWVAAGPDGEMSSHVRKLLIHRGNVTGGKRRQEALNLLLITCSAAQRSTDSTHRGQKRLKFFSAIAAAGQVIMQQGHRLSSIPASKGDLHKLIHLVKTLGAPDLVWTGGGNTSSHLLEHIRIESLA